MNCDIYRASNHKEAYLFVESGLEVAQKVPPKVLAQLGNLEFFKAISFDESSPLIAANPKEIIANISTKGFHIQGAAIRTDEVSEAGAALGAGILAASLGLGPAGAVIGAIAGFVIANISKGGSDVKR